MANRTVEDYLALPYHIEVVYDTSGQEPGWFARVVELPGCMTQADTFEALGPMIQDAMRGWIEIGLEDGQPIPEPLPEEGFSGKFVVRVPRSLHRQLAECADRDGVSLNAFVNVACARAVGAQAAAERHGQVAEGHAHAPAAPAPAWGTLSARARQAMLAAGLQAETEQTDERLFATWLEGQFQQVRAALQGSYMQDAFAHLDQLRQAVGIAGQASPLMQIFRQVVDMLSDQLEEVGQLRQGIVEQATIKQRIKSQVWAQQAQFTQIRSVREVDLSQRTHQFLDEATEGDVGTYLYKRAF